MTKGRLEAFSDGVFAIIITIMVLELKPPHEETIDALLSIWPVFLSYVLSFVNIAIYWNNHHHMFQASQMVSGKILWFNAHLLFWLSLIPFVTAWMGENHFATIPVALYGFVLLMSGVAYYFLAHSLSKLHGRESLLSRAINSDLKGRISILTYAAGIGLAFLHPVLGFILYVIVAVIWFVPDKRFEKEGRVN